MPYTRNPDFVGRTEILEQLKSQLCHGQPPTSGTSQARASFHGLGGIRYLNPTLQTQPAHVVSLDDVVASLIPSNHLETSKLITRHYLTNIIYRLLDVRLHSQNEASKLAGSKAIPLRSNSHGYVR